MEKLIDYIIGLRMLKRVLSVTSSYEHDRIIEAITGGDENA